MPCFAFYGIVFSPVIGALVLQEVSLKLFKVFILISGFGFIFSVLFQSKEAITCELIAFSDFDELQPDVYVDSTLGDVDRKNLLKVIIEGTKRVDSIYGKSESSPRYIATKNEEYARYGLNLTGMHKTAFFRQCIFLGPRGLNTDVVAHELVHAEVSYRADFLTQLTKLPIWFIEGTGVKVDYRKPLLLNNIELDKSKVEDIKKVFFSYNFSNTSIPSYQASRLAIESIEPKLLYEGLERLNKGESFEDVFGK